VPPTAPAKRLAPSVTAKDAPPPAIAADALPTATVKDTPPTASDDVSSTPVIGRLPPSPKPAADYDGFSVGIVDDGDTSGYTTRSVRPRSAKQSKLSQETDSIAGQQSVDQAEEEKLSASLRSAGATSSKSPNRASTIVDDAGVLDAKRSDSA